MEISTHPHNPQYDRKKTELRPCLVVSVDQTSQSIQPSDTRRWVRVDTPPRITWKLNDAWIWVGTPHTVAMVLNNNKVMHPHKDSYYAAPPVAAANLQNYWIHRQDYLMRESNTSTDPITSTYNPSMQTALPYYTAPSNTIYSSNPNPQFPMYPSPSQAQGTGSNTRMYTGSSAYPPQDFTTLSPQPVVVPAGFTEQHPSAPGWWRNPETGWFWHAGRGLLPLPNKQGGRHSAVCINRIELPSNIGKSNKDTKDTLWRHQYIDQGGDTAQPGRVVHGLTRWDGSSRCVFSSGTSMTAIIVFYYYMQAYHRIEDRDSA
ncbi:hypothetical protein C8R44DRAFT_940841 [Mycena epipterygia]|nr:hypothetical protein C8R44DRAFT_940841 [Mycena epipterygia]